MTTNDKWPGHEDPHQRNEALAFFGLPKEAEPEVARAADGQITRAPDPVQAAHSNGENTGRQSIDAVTFLGLNSHHPTWTNVRM